MQFKRGAGERRAPEFKRQDAGNEAPPRQAPAEESRGAYAYNRQPGEEQAAEMEAAEVARAQAAQVESIVDASAEVEGHFQADGNLRIQGTVSGEVTCRGTLTVEQHAVARARINTMNCELYGTVDGDVTCSGRLRIAATAVVNAKVRTASLIVEEGASITGSVETNYSGEVTSAASPRRRSRKEDSSAEAADSDNGNTPRSRRDAPSFALVSSEESAEGRDSRSS